MTGVDLEEKKYGKIIYTRKRQYFLTDLIPTIGHEQSSFRPAVLIIVVEK
jgi:hypothetical protein